MNMNMQSNAESEDRPRLNIFGGMSGGDSRLDEKLMAAKQEYEDSQSSFCIECSSSSAPSDEMMSEEEGGS